MDPTPMDGVQCGQAKSSSRKKVRIREEVTQKNTDRTPDGGFKIMTFYPKPEEMKDFKAYMKKIHEEGGHRAGLAKVVPPAGYSPRRAGYDDDTLYNMEITSPIRQEVSGEGGLYQQMNIVTKKKMSVKNFMRLSEEKHATPIHADQASLERTFWKNIFTNPSIYGADVPGSLFDEDFDDFNLTKLNTILDDIQSDYGVTIQGVNTTYLYFGMWKSSFCWHTEDMDLYSINYLHTGAPKSWYCIAPEYGRRFERLAESFFPQNYKNCKAFLRHKTTLISPQVLKKYSIPFSRCTQDAGEFMITFPYSYHSGFNNGFNVAEATNFATEHWIDFGKWATRCECSAESVKISMQIFVKKYQSDRYDAWIRGKDVCSDPREPKHVAPAPKPTEVDLYVMGIEDRLDNDIEDDKEKVALQPNLSINLKSKSKKTIKEIYHCYNEFLTKPNTASCTALTLPHYAPIPTNMVTTTEYIPIRTCDNLSIEDSVVKDRPDYDRFLKKNIKKEKVKTKKSEQSIQRKEQRAKERIITGQELLQFLPITFTHEKRFNRLIAASKPHCSVCQLLELHPKDDQSIWGLEGEFSLTSSCILLPRSAFEIVFNESVEDSRVNDTQDHIDLFEFDLNEPCDLLQCCVCMLAVHRVCYGVIENQVAKKDWVCDRCIQPNRSTLNCALCPCRGGALKLIGDQWAHITCALTLTQIRLNDLTPRGSAKAQLKLTEAGDKNDCIYCSTNTNLNKYVQGKCMLCEGFPNEGGCDNLFHTTCGHRNGALFKVRNHHKDSRNLVSAFCADCAKVYIEFMHKEPGEQSSEDSESVPLAIGSSVIAYSHKMGFCDGTVQSQVKKTTYDLYIPEANEINRNVSDRNIIDLDKSRDYKVGDRLLVRESGREPAEGKFLQKHYHDSEYVIQIDKSSKTERVSRGDIYLNIDQLPNDHIETYLESNGSSQPID